MTVRSIDETGAWKKRVIAWLVASTFFMELFDGTVIATALPKIAASFGRSAVELNVGMSAYLLTLGVFIPVSGWVADRFGTRTVFGSAISVFTAASILCGLSGGLWTFTGARILQGVGGAMMVPVGRLVVLRTTPKKDLLPVLAMIVWPGLIAPVIGPAVGGFFATYLTWRWIFFLNLPLGLVAIALNFAVVPNLHSGERRRLDVIGFVLSGFSVVSLIYGFDALGAGRGSARLALASIALGAVAGVASVRHFRKASEPLLELDALKLKTFHVFAAGGSLFRVAIGTTPFLLPLMFQLSFGLRPVDSGLLLMPLFLGTIAIKPATIPLLRVFGFRNILIFNGILVPALLAAPGLFSPSTPKTVMMAVLFVAGTSRSLQFTSINTLQFAEVPEERMSRANTLSSTITQITMGVGVAAGALAIDMFGWLRGAAPGDGPALNDFRYALFFVGAASLLSMLDYLGLPKDAGNAIARRGVIRERRRENSSAEEERA